MRRSMLILLTMCLLLLMAVVAVPAQTPAEEPAADSSNATALLVGVRSEGTKLLFPVGIQADIGGGLHLFEYVDLGFYNVLNNELAYLFEPTDWLMLGPLAGPNIDWKGPTSGGGDYITYLVGAAGGMARAHYKSVGLWGFMKYKFSAEEGNSYPDGYHWGGGLLIKL